MDFVSAQEVKEELLKESILVTDNDIDSVSETKIISIGVKKILRYAAVACILPLAFYSFWIPFKSDFFSSGLISVDDLNPFYTKEAGKYEPKPSKHFITVEETSTHTNNAVQNSESNKIEEIVQQEAIMAEKNISASEVSSTNQKKCLMTNNILWVFCCKGKCLNYKNKIEGDGFPLQLASQVTYIEFQWVYLFKGGV